MRVGLLASSPVLRSGLRHGDRLLRPWPRVFPQRSQRTAECGKTRRAYLLPGRPGHSRTLAVPHPEPWQMLLIRPREGEQEMDISL